MVRPSTPGRGSGNPLANGQPPTQIRVNAIEESLDARRPLSHLSDGLPTSGWRHPTYGASCSGREVTLALRVPARFNHLEVDVFHEFRGKFVRASLEDRLPPQTELMVPRDRMNWRASLERPMTTRRLRIHRELGRIAEVRLWETMRREDALGLRGAPLRTFNAVAPLAAEPSDVDESGEGGAADS